MSKRERYVALWPITRKMFLEMCIRVGKECPITLRPITMSSDVHHMKGRGLSYADQWAEDNDIPLLLDPRHFLAVSREGHQYIETHPAEANERGWSASKQDTITNTAI